MDYAVVLYFDKESEKVLTEYMHQICREGVNPYMLDMGIRPHITLAIFKNISTNDIHRDLLEFTRENIKFTIRLGSIGVFTSDPSVVYLSPTYAEQLYLIHNRFYKFFNSTLDEYVPYYLPDSWIPHCTMATRLQKEEVMKSIGFLLDKFRPLDAEIVEIGFIECDPIKEICCYEIKKYDLG